jgi:hypothetical protein
MQILGRRDANSTHDPVARIGRYRAPDGSDGAPVGLDLDAPHAVLVVGKRGYGKSYTLGVLAEEAARARGVAPVVVDPMGAFAGLADAARGDAVPARVVESPTVRADALPPAAWPPLVGLAPDSAAGALVWQAASDASTLAGMRAAVEDTDSARAARRAAANHLRMAHAWGVFAPDAPGVTSLADGRATVVDASGLDPSPMNAVVAAIARGLYRSRLDGRLERLPWLLLDEAHAFFDGVAASALRTLLTRGRAPGVSLVAATQRPGVLPSVAVSQADVVLSHRLTAGVDLDALRAAEPTYLHEALRDRMPSAPGRAVVVDDATESVHGVRIRRRDTPHAGGSPTASARADALDERSSGGDLPVD